MPPNLILGDKESAEDCYQWDEHAGRQDPWRIPPRVLGNAFDKETSSHEVLLISGFIDDFNGLYLTFTIGCNIQRASFEGAPCSHSTVWNN